LKGATEWYFNGGMLASRRSLVDKPRRRKKGGANKARIASVVVVALLVGAAGWYVYQAYIYKPAPIYARIDTSLGWFEVELYPACAPKTVANFVSLANSGFYNNLVWHRIVPDFVIQTGDPNTRGGLNSTRSTWGQGGSNATVPLEVGGCSWLGNYEGYVSMARQGNLTTGFNTGTSQFFINLSNSTSNQSLNGYYTVFGKVISGMPVVKAIAAVQLCLSPTCPSTWPAGEPLNPVFVTAVYILQSP
jgi:peptidyl-prolyl cis-trans isomerase B (cyclophilin B)